MDAPTTHDRILFTSAELFRRQGYSGTGLKQIATQAEAPFGSVYHHWPDGKRALAEEVLRTGGAFFLALYRQIVDEAPDLLTAADTFFSGAAETLRATDFADACPIATVAGEVANTDDVLRRTSAEVFESWLAAFQTDLRASGVAARETRAIALSLLAILEGAFLLCRTLRDTEPMDAAGQSAVKLLSAAGVDR